MCVPSDLWLLLIYDFWGAEWERAWRTDLKSYDIGAENSIKLKGGSFIAYGSLCVISSFILTTSICWPCPDYLRPNSSLPQNTHISSQTGLCYLIMPPIPSNPGLWEHRYIFPSRLSNDWCKSPIWVRNYVVSSILFLSYMHTEKAKRIYML